MKNVVINCRVMGSLSVQNNSNTYLQLIFLLDILNNNSLVYDLFLFFNTFNAKFDELINNVMVLMR